MTLKPIPKDACSAVRQCTVTNSERKQFLNIHTEEYGHITVYFVGFYATFC